ncbi:MAG: alpha/beta hydrolase [Planctomycetia bacterium]|nr:alpha/beta hydrolase [Planctomycetia bacterium]
MKQTLKVICFFCFLIAFQQHLFAVETSESTKYPGDQSEWNGFNAYDFMFENRSAKIVVPQKRADSSPWIWRARFFGHEPQADIALLQKGFHLVYIDSAPLMGSPGSVELWQKYYLYLTQEFNLCSKVHLEGMSRGGLYAMNWAIAYPNQVASIYIDNPVLDFKSWPGGFGKGARSESDWQSILESYNLTEDEAQLYRFNPVDHFEPLAETKVPILIVCGDADRVVPYEENTKILKEGYEKANAPITVIVKPGNDHHPHSLENPEPIVHFILEAQKKIAQ